MGRGCLPHGDSPGDSTALRGPVLRTIESTSAIHRESRSLFTKNLPMGGFLINDGGSGITQNSLMAVFPFQASRLTALGAKTLLWSRFVEPTGFLTPMCTLDS